jgi:NADPH:quinone reductase-like Zn-dependent oxidoreductase
LTELAQFKPGQSVLAPAIGSAVGMESVQLARRLGASLAISTASTTSKAELRWPRATSTSSTCRKRA